MAKTNQIALKNWVRGIKDAHCAGNAARFGRAIGKDSSYVSRMLATGTKQARGISDNMINLILSKFPNATPPEGWYEYIPSEMVGNSAAEILRLRQMVVALASALVSKSNVQDAVQAFRKNFLAAATMPGRLDSLERGLSMWLQNSLVGADAPPAPQSIAPSAKRKQSQRSA